MAPDRGHRVAISIPSILGYEEIVTAVASGLAEQIDFPEERIPKLRSAVSEACANAIEHGNKQDPSVPVNVTYDPSRLQIDLIDQGPGLKEMPKKPDRAAQLARKESPRGWGIFLIKHMVDELSFAPGADGGHVTRLIFHLET